MYIYTAYQPGGEVHGERSGPTADPDGADQCVADQVGERETHTEE